MTRTSLPLFDELPQREPRTRARTDRHLQAARQLARRMAAEEGLFAGISAAGACWVALQIAKTVENATIVFVVCDRGDRYLSTGVFPA